MESSLFEKLKVEDLATSPRPCVVPRENAMESLRNTFVRQAVENEAILIQKELKKMKNSSNELSDKVDGMERELALLRLDLSKAQRLNQVYQTDIERLHAERRQMLWRNFDLELENDILKHTLNMYRKDYKRESKRRQKLRQKNRLE